MQKKKESQFKYLSSCHSLDSSYYNPSFTVRTIKHRGVQQLTQGPLESMVKPGETAVFCVNLSGLYPQ